MNPSENLMRAMNPLLKNAQTHTHNFASFAVMSKHSEPHPQSQSNNPFSHSPSQPSFPSSPQLFICSLTRFPWCFPFFFLVQNSNIYFAHTSVIWAGLRGASLLHAVLAGAGIIWGCACTCLEVDAGK